MKIEISQSGEVCCTLATVLQRRVRIQFRWQWQCVWFSYPMLSFSSFARFKFCTTMYHHPLAIEDGTVRLFERTFCFLALVSPVAYREASLLIPSFRISLPTPTSSFRTNAYSGEKSCSSFETTISLSMIFAFCCSVAQFARCNNHGYHSGKFNTALPYELHGNGIARCMRPCTLRRIVCWILLFAAVWRCLSQQKAGNGLAKRWGGRQRYHKFGLMVEADAIM